MSDFSVLADSHNRDEVVTIELRSGAANLDKIRQLRAGLELLYQHSQHIAIYPEPRAILVVGKRSAQLRRLIVNKRIRLRFGSNPVEVEVMDSGSSIDI